LTDGQTLRIYQEMRRRTKRPAHNTFNACPLAMKDAPFVNMFDLLDACRTGDELKTLISWQKFCDYTTMPGMRIDLAYAKDNELPAQLLQDLTKGQNAHNPVAQRERLLGEWHRRLRACGLNSKSCDVLAKTEWLDPVPIWTYYFRSDNTTSSASAAVGIGHLQPEYPVLEQEDLQDSAACTASLRAEQSLQPE
jgi:hypothetical protein